MTKTETRPTHADFADLRGRCEGPVLLPDDQGFDEEIAGFQTGFDNQPAVVVGATSSADVCAAVREARRFGLGVAVQATGHGRSRSQPGALLIGTKRMKQLHVDLAARTAVVAAGVHWKEVIARAVPHGLVPVSGSAPEVGAVGYTLGGGTSILGLQFGYAADHVRWLDLVTADGELRRVDGSGEDAELFWGLRGAGANFGVVTAMEIDLMPLERLYGGGLYFDQDLIPAALDLFQQWTQRVPEEMTSSICVLRYPPVSAIPAPIRGKMTAHVRFAFGGDPSIGEELVAPFRALGARLIDSVDEMSFRDAGSIYNDPPMPHAYVADNRLLARLDDGVLRAVREAAATPPPIMCVADVRHIGGAMARPPAAPNAVGRRDAQYVVRILSPIGEPGVGAIAPHHERFIEAVQEHALGRSVNFVYGHESSDRLVRSLFEVSDFQRLQALKTAYDPGNLFRHTYNIPPA